MRLLWQGGSGWRRLAGAPSLDYDAATTTWVNAMALNIKNREAEQLAHDLAKLTGETLTDTVTTALRERLERERVVRERRVVDVSARIAALQAKVRAVVGDEPAPDHDALLYDRETGLPK
jgi:antitoxin VapB